MAYYLLCGSVLLQAQSDAVLRVLPLSGGWEFAEAGTEEWRRAEVPGTIHQDLLRHGLLPDPFYGKNEEKVQWVEDKDWEYRTTFTVTSEQLSHDAASLIFEGLDTYADVYLNGSLLLRADNMFVGHSIPVKQVLREGENRLRVYFHSPIRKTLPQFESNGFNYPADNDHHEKHLSVFSRKAPYSYGWDWGIRLVTSGIWRPVAIRFEDVAVIGDYCVKQLSLTDEQAVLRNELEVINVLPDSVEAEVQIHVSLKGNTQATEKCDVMLKPGLNCIAMASTIASPVRWMPNGWGEAVLYRFSARVLSRGNVVAEKTHRIGLRTIRVVNEKDKDGESFFFEVNGIPMFAKGANYIPQDPLLPSVTTERYERLFRDIKAAHMNMIRVWGGGVYEDDRFYDLADENGILIWQDFMFACTPYPADPAFLKRVEAEADYNIRRLRNHASLAIWCGNNEIREALNYWGYQKKYTPDVYRLMLQNYDKLFRELLPEKVKQWDDRFYVHSSPYEANWGRPATWGVGDSHNWGVWYGQKPFESLNADIPRFMSEFGFQSFPELKTIAAFADPKDYAIESPVMNAHQKSNIGNALIRTYMERDYIVPESFEDFVYVSSVLQGHGIRTGLQAHRRNRPYCMGTLYWQLNDSWPVVSWSGIDYYGNWKALHYQAKRAFEAVVVDVLRQGDSLSVYLLSDRLTPLENLTLELAVGHFDGKIAGKKKEVRAIRLPSNASPCIYRVSTDELLPAEAHHRCYLTLTLKEHSGKKMAETLYFFCKPKDMSLPKTDVKYSIKSMNGRCEVTLWSSRFAKDVFMEVPIQGARFSDNFFDLRPGEKKTVVISSPAIRKGEKIGLKIKHLRETY